MAEKGLSFVRTAIVDDDPEVVIQRFLTVTAGTPEYTVASAGSGSVVLTRRYTPTWAIVVAVVGVLLFLIGLLALLVKQTETLTITAVASPEGTRVAISGVASAALATRLNAAMSTVGVTNTDSGISIGAGEVRAADGDVWHCSGCGAERPSSATGCDNCGTLRDVYPVVPVFSARLQRCPAGHEVPGADRFCPQCGAPTHMQCRSGHDLPTGAKFCGKCGEPAVAAVRSDPLES